MGPVFRSLQKLENVKGRREWMNEDGGKSSEACRGGGVCELPLVQSSWPGP